MPRNWIQVQACIRGISEYASALLLTLIVLAVGSTLVVYVVNLVNEKYTRAEQVLVREQLQWLRSVEVMGAFVENGTVTVVLVTGDAPVNVQGTYINNNAVSCTISFRGASYTTLPVEVPPNTIAVVRCDIGVNAAVEVKIVSDAGDLVVKAAPL